MQKFRRSGSLCVFFVEGKLPSPRGEHFAAALKRHRFRTIEDAAGEDSSTGWISPDDPSGDSFDLEAMEQGEAIWLRMRSDRKQLPAKWVAIYRAAAERSKGGKLTPRERKELQEDLQEKLLPRVLPAVNFVDALWFEKLGRILLFATSKAARENFDTLFCKTFDARLLAGDPYLLALRSGLADAQLRYLDQVSPVKWPKEARPARTAKGKAAVEAGP